jgi:hypothetical protein
LFFPVVACLVSVIAGLGADSMISFAVDGSGIPGEVISVFRSVDLIGCLAMG